MGKKKILETIEERLEDPDLPVSQFDELVRRRDVIEKNIKK